MVVMVPPIRKSLGWRPAERIPTTFPGMFISFLSFGPVLLHLKSCKACQRGGMRYQLSKQASSYCFMSVLDQGEPGGYALITSKIDIVDANCNTLQSPIELAELRKATKIHESYES